MISTRAAEWRMEIERELKDHILSFWMEHTVDHENGGFYGEVSDDLEISSEADKGLVLNARILWTFAKAYRTYGDLEYLNMADRAYGYLTANFRDSDFGGYYWMLDHKGKPVDDRKQIYGQAFVIYALTEYYQAVPKQEVLQQAAELYHLLEKHSYDKGNRGYFEAYARDWNITESNSLSEKDLNEKKSMNTHLHILEAYTNLLRVWDSASLKHQLRELIEITLKYIISADSYHFLLFFDEEWNVKSDHVSYGHDIEGSWLLLEAAEVLGDEALLTEVKKIAVLMAQVTYDEGLDADGGLINEADSRGWVDTDKHWWPQAEAMVGFLNAYQLTLKPYFLQAAYESWRFTDRYICDRTYGEWLWKVSKSGEPYANGTKVDPWKCPYHNSRACFELLERMDSHLLSL
jgi:mannobiose 2-epimerase